MAFISSSAALVLVRYSLSKACTYWALRLRRRGFRRDISPSWYRESQKRHPLEPISMPVLVDQASLLSSRQSLFSKGQARYHFGFWVTYVIASTSFKFCRWLGQNGPRYVRYTNLFQRLSLEARRVFAKITLGKVCFTPIFPAQQATTKRTIRDERNPQFAAGVQDTVGPYVRSPRWELEVTGQILQ